MFNDNVAHAIIAAAQANHIDPAAMLAIVEVETGGKTFEQDNRTPQFLYERHIAWREAKKRSADTLTRFRRAGLAIPHWDRSTQYKDERTSAMRLDLIGRARAIDTDCANRSASWGLGQTMGFLAEELGFADAEEMVAHQTGSISGQIDCMVRELRHSDLIKSLNAHDWVRVARIYNGAGYAENRYDTRLRDAYTRWSRKLPQLYAEPSSETVPLPKPRPAPPEQTLAKDEIEAIQTKLRALGYHEVGDPEGTWGTKTTAAISAFQAHEGLPVTGHYDDATKAAFEGEPLPRPNERERSDATADDLRKKGSDTITHADKLTYLASLKKWCGGLLVAGGAADQGGLFGTASDALDKADQVKSTWERVQDMLHPVFGDPKILIVGAVLLIAGIAVAYLAEQIIANRVKDHQSGEHAGPTPGEDT